MLPSATIFKVRYSGINYIYRYVINKERALNVSEKYDYLFEDNSFIKKAIPFLTGDEGYLECGSTIAYRLGVPEEYVVRKPLFHFNILFKTTNRLSPGEYLYHLVRMPEQLTFEINCHQSILEFFPQLLDIVKILKDIRCSIYNKKLEYGEIIENEYPTLYFTWDKELIKRYIKTSDFIIQMRYLSIFIAKYFITVNV